MTVVQKHRSFRFGSPEGLLSSQMAELIRSFHAPAKKAEGRLTGRVQVQTCQLERIGPVMIKTYFRGGLLRHINKRTYLGLGRARSRAEFEMLQRVRQIGINAPEPVAYAVQGRLLYRAWLITKQIPGAVPLSELSFTDPATAQSVLPSVAEQIRILACRGIHHVDLHPGNVLLDARGRAFFIDFDRARGRVRSQRRLFRRYAQRWKRAADKYGLPGFVREALSGHDPG
ncbi:MAG: hypothetical protein KGY42_04585 [Desulfobacterales bacterium]|nr:hypothetical protein [Desulfobacterales bacterium]MBS3755634.1 hypothetical protein [Desulfobacterales bacterium]